MSASVFVFPMAPTTELPDLPELGPDVTLPHRETILDALRHQHDCLRELYLAEDRPRRYAPEYAKPERDPLRPFTEIMATQRRSRMAAKVRRVRAALRALGAR